MADTFDRRPGPPPSGEKGWYEILFQNSENIGSLWWSRDRYYAIAEEDHNFEVRRKDIIPLHDYPLVPGDEMRRLQEELEEARKTVNWVLERAKDKRREAFDAGREYFMLDNRVVAWKYRTFDDYQTAKAKEQGGEG